MVCPSIFKNEPQATQMVDSSELKIEHLIEELRNRNSVGFTLIDMFKLVAVGSSVGFRIQAVSYSSFHGPSRLVVSMKH